MIRLHLAFFLIIMGFSAAQGSPENPGIGMNLAAVVDYTTEQPFVDVFKTASPWISQREGADWGQGGPLALTPEGWIASLEPGQYAETILFSADRSYPAGEYLLLYEGEGEFAFRFSNAAVVNSEPGRLVVNVTPADNGIFLQIVTTNPENPIRNIRFLMPGTEQLFNPIFLERLAPFSPLRFMDWMATNHSSISTWEERPQVTDATYMLRGVPVEVMVTLANTLRADAWFNMPHQATDDYVRSFATYVRDHLDPALRVYIEYSNETWNGAFSQAGYVMEQGNSLNLAGDDAFLAGLRFHSQRAVEMFGIWEDVFGGTERLVRVLASQAGNAWTGEQVASWQNAYEHADALAIAPYFSCDDPGSPATADAVAALTVDELLDRQMANVRPGGCAHQMVVDNLEVARRFGLQLVAYEGGQHLAGYGGAENNETLTALFIEANRHPRMGEIYLEYLRMWQASGGGLFLHFNDATIPSKFGSWGALETIGQENAPKYEALLTFLNEAQ